MTKDQENVYNRRMGDQIDSGMTVVKNMFASKLDKSDKKRTERFDKFEKEHMSKLDQILEIVETNSTDLKDLKTRMDGNVKDGEPSLPKRVKIVEDKQVKDDKDKIKFVAFLSGIGTVVGFIGALIQDWWFNK